LAQTPYKAPEAPALPPGLKDLGYDRYRAIRYLPERALWRAENLPFEAQFFHRGFHFTAPVAVHQVVRGRAQRVGYSPDLFSFGELERPEPSANLGFAGFRLHAPFNRADYYDEIGAFLGASYFRAVGKGQTYGLSARGLSINTGDPKGEEFPGFRAFWIERPQPGIGSIVVHALLDSESAAAAYRFTIRPDVTTVYDVEMALYPRVEIKQPGIATLTSMFFFAPNDRGNVDDFRPAVHDSDGMAMRNGRGEQLWRPLHNPQDLQVSSFADTNPRGFGLMQRQRGFAAYQDLEARYERRPSCWVEPIGDWGEGDVTLFEIPTKNEYNDNIVAFWRPREPLQAKGEYTFVYRLHWGAADPHPAPLAAFTQTRIGHGSENRRLFVLDAGGERLKGLDASAPVRADVVVDRGKVEHVVVQPNPELGGWRMSFQLAAEKAPAVELRAQLRLGDEGLSEIWTYRWTP
jgi:glucans biosynthesis protein